jgi:lipopolysaccharide biosynthesis glycosyltransferase
LIRLFCGYDPREAAAYHVFCESVIRSSHFPVSFIPLHKPMLGGFDGQRDGTNAFIFSRYLVPLLCEYEGWAIFADGDMVVTRDILELWNYQSEYFDKAACVVKHDYKTRHPRKYRGSYLESSNVDYPRKNWSSLILWNCGHPANKVLTHEYVRNAKPQEIHRFSWLQDRQIGELPPEWNHLVGEHGPSSAALHHYTLGVPGFRHYADDYSSWNWHASLNSALECGGEDIVKMVKRSKERVGAI